MTITEQILHDIWYIRFKLARPDAEDRGIERGIKAVLADPMGPYAREIKETAERREYAMTCELEREDAPFCVRCGTRMVEGEPKTYGCPKCGYELGV